MFNRKIILSGIFVGVASIGLLLPMVASRAQDGPAATGLDSKAKIERARADVKRLQEEVQQRQQDLQKALQSLKEAEGGRNRSRDVVATLYDNQVSITRAEFGEYLVARFGAERLEFMINRKIVEIECRKLKIVATDAEVEERFRQDLKTFGSSISAEEFEKIVLRRFNKTMFEWKEDVIRPKLMMEKFVRATTKVSDAELAERSPEVFAEMRKRAAPKMVLLP